VRIIRKLSLTPSDPLGNPHAQAAAGIGHLPMIGSDLVKRTGGMVPGFDHDEGGAVPAFVHVVPRSAPMPVLISVPHAGRAYPPALLRGFRDAAMSRLRLEDRHVDQLGVAVARATGTGLLVAQAPRAMLDLNRAHDDIDWDMVSGANPAAQDMRRKNASNRRARSGLGLVPRRLPGFGEIWREPLPLAELEARIDQVHRPYHDFLARELEYIRDQWGAALLIDLHSMPPLRRQAGQVRAPQIVLGDRFGASCDPSLMDRALRHLEAAGCEAAHNRPYAGGFVLDRHASTSRGIHAMQVEVCRSAYLDERLERPCKGLGPLAQLLAGLVRELGAHTARLARGNAMGEAAE
jgi:N-formylglutamate amidohydrolase